MSVQPPSFLDCAVVGGGPAGLTAAVYLARFRRTFRLVDLGDSRARWIPLIRNYPGFPSGVSGEALLGLMRDQARRYRAELEPGRATNLLAVMGGFRLDLEDGAPIFARTVILATGVVENPPGLPHLVEAVKAGVVRICPICDGFEAAGKAVGVLGAGDHAATEALFLRSFSDRVCLVLTGEPPAATRRQALADAGVEVTTAPVQRVHLGEDGKVRVLGLGGNELRQLDTLYSAFGVTPRSSLAAGAGAACDDDGRLIVGDHQETSVPGLFAIGDLVRGLNQIGVAVGEAALAATAVHNRLPQVLA